MARFYITPDQNSHQTASSACAEAQLQPVGKRDGDIYLTTYQKRTIDSQNYLVTGDGDFVAVTGTLVLNGSIGGEALPDVAELYAEEGAQAVRDQAIGHYAVTIKQGDTIEIFCDPNSVYHLYYKAGDDWFVSNSLSLCGRVLDDRKIDRYALYRRIIESTEVGAQTLFSDVYRLSAREKIVIDTTSNAFEVRRLPLPEQDWTYKDASLDAVLSDYISRVKNVFDQLVTAADGIGIQATGGLDSRSVLAGVLNQGDSPTLIYGVGNSKITNTKEEDRDIVKQSVDKFGLPYYEMDWSGEFPIDVDDWDRLFEKYGFRYRIYGGIPNFFQEFEQGIFGNPELVLDGYGFGTHSNNFYWEDDSLVPLMFSELVTNVFSAATEFSADAFLCKKKYINELLDVCEQALIELGEEVDRDKMIDRQELTRYIQLLNGRPQSTYINIANEFTYHLGPFATYNLGRPMIDFPPEQRVGEHIRIKLIKELSPELLQIPVYSGTRQQRFTDDDQLEPVGSEQIGIWLGSVLPKPLVERIRPAYDSLIKGSTASNTDMILESHENRVADDGLISECFDISLYDKHIRRHSRFALFEHGIRKLGYSDVTPR